MPFSRDQVNARLRAARRRPRHSGQPATRAELDEAERGILARQSEAANKAALPQPKTSKPS